MAINNRRLKKNIKKFSKIKYVDKNHNLKCDKARVPSMALEMKCLV